MKTDKFIKLCLSNITFITPKLSGIHDWEFYRKIAALTEYINYGCDFDETGLCSLNRGYSDNIKSDDRRKMCCCSGCRREIGYLRNIDKAYLDKYAKLFNNTTGFWRNDEGCILPRQLRSPVCLIYKCRFDMKKQKPNTKIVFDLLHAMNSNGELLKIIMYRDMRTSDTIKTLRGVYKTMFDMFMFGNHDGKDVERQNNFIEDLKKESKQAFK